VNERELIDDPTQVVMHRDTCRICWAEFDRPSGYASICDACRNSSAAGPVESRHSRLLPYVASDQPTGSGPARTAPTVIERRRQQVPSMAEESDGA
jgi:hypothetical protein